MFFYVSLELYVREFKILHKRNAILQGFCLEINEKTTIEF